MIDTRGHDRSGPVGESAKILLRPSTWEIIIRPGSQAQQDAYRDFVSVSTGKGLTDGIVYRYSA